MKTKQTSGEKMTLKNPANLVVAVLVAMTSMVGCTHKLDIKNLRSYYNTSNVSYEGARPLRIGVRSTCEEFEERRIVQRIGSSLSSHNASATSSIKPDKSNVDVIATFSALSEYKGSGWNFLVNFPGFLVWAPAWHGYNYEVSHNISVQLSDAKTGKNLKTIHIPVVLDILHADINRTWTEVSWLEFGVIAFVGGIVFIQYDDTVTPLVEQKAGPVVADFIAKEIIEALQSYEPSILTEKAKKPAQSNSVEARLEKITILKNKGILSETEYQTRRKAIITEL
jgi:hypothetical protein